MSDPSFTPEMPGGAPPTEQGDFVPVKPPESWPTVIGVLSIVFGTLGVLSKACDAVGLLFMDTLISLVPDNGGEDLEAQMAASMQHVGLQAGVTAIEFALAVLLLVGGIMLIMRKPASAKVLVAFAWLDLLSNTIGAVVGYLVFQAQMEAMQNDPEMQQAAAAMPGFMQSMGMAGFAIGWVLAAIWPVFLILWFMRAKIRESVASWE